MVKKKQVKVVIAPRKIGKKKKTRSARVRQEREVTRLGGALRALGGLGGGAVGSMFGMGPAGGALGTSLGASLSKWLGSGAYTVARNSVLDRVDAGGIPAMHTNAQSVIVRHKEYLGPVTGSTGFSVVNRYILNPGDVLTFPWLSGIANRFQEYRILGAVFHYVPTSGTAISGTNPALGSVMLQTTYRSSDTAPISKQEILNEYWSSESPPNEAFCHPIECDPKENPFNVQYVRSGTPPSGDSTLLYDLGVTNVAVQGQLATGNTLGDLWLTYEVELKKPIVSSNATSHYRLFQGLWNGSIVTNNHFPSLVHDQGNLPITVSNNVITFPPGSSGHWLIVHRLYATGNFTAVDLTGAPTLVNATIVFGTDGSNYNRTAIGGSPTTNAIFYYTCVAVTDPNIQATVTLPDGTWTGTATESTLIVVPGFF